MTKEIINKSTAALAVPEGGWNDGDFSADDLLIPRILIAQGSSDVVKQGKIGIGQAYDNTNKTVLADQKKQMRFIPIKLYKTWKHYELIDGRAQFRSEEPLDTSNINKYKQYEVERKSDGALWTHYQVFNFYIVIEEELRGKNSFPFLLSFQSTNAKKGRPLINAMARARALNPPRPLCSMMFDLSTVLTTKGKDSWFNYDLSSAGETPQEHMGKCLDWLNTINLRTHKIDDQGLHEEVENAVVEVIPPGIKKGEVTKEARY